MLALGCDQAGYGLMQEVKKHLDERGLKYVDCGTYSEDSVDYPVYSKKVVKEILEGRCDRGILICGTGIGISITATVTRGSVQHCAETASAQRRRDFTMMRTFLPWVRV